MSPLPPAPSLAAGLFRSDLADSETYATHDARAPAPDEHKAPESPSHWTGTTKAKVRAIGAVQRSRTRSKARRALESVATSFRNVARRVGFGDGVDGGGRGDEGDRAARRARPRRRRMSVREKVLDELYLGEVGNKATVTLLMRGMPTPVTFGFPGTDGSLGSNVWGFVCLFHPLISVWKVHPLCPFSGKERLVVFVCSVAFNFLWSTFIEFQAQHGHGARHTGQWHAVGLVLTKHVVTVLYAVLIRQLVICPCLYKGMLDDLESRTKSEGEIERRAAFLRRWKIIGDRVLVFLFLTHAVIIGLVLDTLFNDDWFPGHSNARQLVWKGIVFSEAFNFVGWFLKFAPLFAGLYPLHRAQWFEGGSVGDYASGRRSLGSYRTSPNYLDAAFPRCVVPESGGGDIHSAKLFSSIKHWRGAGSSGGFSLSTFRRRSEMASFASKRGESAGREAGPSLA